VAILGNNYVNGEVGNAVVAVLGNIELGPKAKVGEVICIGGTVKRDPNAIVRGQVQTVAVGAAFGGMHDFGWFHAWVEHCLSYGRLLAFAPHLAWAWTIAIAILLLYALVGLIFHRSVDKCVDTLERRPGMSILTTILTILLTPVVFVLLLITVVGIAVVPFLAIGLFVAKIFGKVVVLAWLGRRVLALTNGSRNAFPTALAVLIGGLIVLLLYTVPVLGMIVYQAVGLLGLGVVVLTLAQANKRKQAAPIPLVPPTPSVHGAPTVPPVVPPPVAPFAPVTPAEPVAPLATATPESTTGAPIGSAPTATAPGNLPPSFSDAGVAAAVPPAIPPPPPVPPVTPPPIAPPPLAPQATAANLSAATLPRAGFWLRIAASAIDGVLVGIALGLLPHFIRGNFLMVYATYCVIMWALKSTTVGGIVCGLKVVRLDDRPVDWITAIVRALAGFLSLFAAGLGFVWVSFDMHSQSWHDKIAGTTVVIVPRGTSLV